MVLRAARTTRHVALAPPARARCLTRHPRRRRRSLACACRHNMVRFVARKERKHVKPITVHARPPPARPRTTGYARPGCP
jgi:hypothetical protein